MKLLLQLDQPLRGQVDVLQQYPTAKTETHTHTCLTLHDLTTLMLCAVEMDWCGVSC